MMDVKELLEQIDAVILDRKAQVMPKQPTMVSRATADMLRAAGMLNDQCLVVDGPALQENGEGSNG